MNIQARTPPATSFPLTNEEELQQPEAPSDARPESLRLGPGADIHGGIYAIIGGAYAWMIFVLWLALNADGEAVFMIAISTFFLAMYAGIPAALTAIGRNPPEYRSRLHSDFAEFLDRKFSTSTGTISGREAALQILSIPVILALGMTLMAFIIVNAQS